MLTRRVLLKRALGGVVAAAAAKYTDLEGLFDEPELEYVSHADHVHIHGEILKELYLPAVRDQLNRETLLLRMDMKRDLNRQFYGA